MVVPLKSIASMEKKEFEEFMESAMTYFNKQVNECSNDALLNILDIPKYIIRGLASGKISEIEAENYIEKLDNMTGSLYTECELKKL